MKFFEYFAPHHYLFFSPSFPAHVSFLHLNTFSNQKIKYISFVLISKQKRRIDSQWKLLFRNHALSISSLIKELHWKWCAWVILCPVKLDGKAKDFVSVSRKTGIMSKFSFYIPKIYVKILHSGDSLFLSVKLFNTDMSFSVKYSRHSNIKTKWFWCRPLL